LRVRDGKTGCRRAKRTKRESERDNAREEWVMERTLERKREIGKH
jgi:hypothetical protein